MCQIIVLPEILISAISIETKTEKLKGMYPLFSSVGIAMASLLSGDKCRQRCLIKLFTPPFLSLLRNVYNSGAGGALVKPGYGDVSRYFSRLSDGCVTASDSVDSPAIGA